MKKEICCRLLVVALFAILTSCAGGLKQDSDSSSQEVVAEIEVVKRYGIPVDGFRLQELTLRSGQTMGDIMSSNGRSAGDIDRIDRAARNVFPLRKMQAGKPYTLFFSSDSLGNEHLDYIAYERNPVDYVLFTMLADSVGVTLESKPTRIVRTKRRVVINTSMWGAIMEAKLPYSLAIEMEEIYQWSVDFFGIQPEDSFTVVYDEKFVEDSLSVGIGQIWGAKFVQSGRSYYALPFMQGDKVEFWDEMGGSVRKQMLKAPLKYSRISSRYSNARLHPIYKVYRPHHGVDYAAPTGTPVHSVADGVVTFKGWSGGGGNTLKIKHPNDIVTGYLHLSRYEPNIASGTKVTQGQLIGYVGSTGDSTGPHLDYRVWRHGVAMDPLKIPQEPTKPISDENLEAFNYVKERIIAELNGDVEESEKIKSLDRPIIKSDVVAAVE